MVHKFTNAVLALLLTLVAAPALAQWTLDNDASELSFVTVKADHVAEVHTFEVLSGSVASNGDVSISIELASVNTLIPIRNERMQAMLFEIDLFPEAEITSSVNMDELLAMQAGESDSMSLELDLDMHGRVDSYTTDVIVTRTGTGVVVSSLKPIVVNAANHDFVSGVESLREVAGLPSISRAVPVSFTVVFD